MEIDYTPKLTYADVLLTPSHSDIRSRVYVDIRTKLLDHNGNGWHLLPIISANMDYVTGPKMAYAMQQHGALGILNRFENQYMQDTLLLESGLLNPAFISVGIRYPENEIHRIRKLGTRIQGVCIDVAHGYHENVIALIRQIRATFPDLYVVAGNVATPEGYWALADAGAHAIKVGIGPGSVCTTRDITGVGVPQFSAILDCAPEARVSKTSLIADGGINSSGDIVKALAAGADSVMVGHLLAGHDECPGDTIVLQPGSRHMKRYRGQSINGSNGERYAPEGVEGYVPVRGPVADTLKRLVGGIKSGFSYLGARNIEELREKARFIVVSGGTGHENGTRVEI